MMTPPPIESTTKNRLCAFCGKTDLEVRKLIAGPSVFICDECVDLCNDILEEQYLDQLDHWPSAGDIPMTEAEIDPRILMAVLRHCPWVRVLVRRAPAPDAADR